ncbi:hypothetical protein FHX34_101762 [Actinoplanes teichomyceticus]|uniref:Uncharacterized protein n=2 Tax=Actinoplanes teichomyceticus TaxID=1867 RepID=A0A561WPJ7_ACTTI|nr:hypothetical protein FHX34_101762 [Actinoplanes teichomyceticus]GIF10866.1 hypothetical protein Ate01nite_08980 [Actinoplanes teichomyceticus]
MTAAGLALIAGGLATMISFRTVLFGGGDDGEPGRSRPAPPPGRRRSGDPARNGPAAPPAPEDLPATGTADDRQPDRPDHREPAGTPAARSAPRTDPGSGPPVPGRPGADDYGRPGAEGYARADRGGVGGDEYTGTARSRTGGDGYTDEAQAGRDEYRTADRGRAGGDGYAGEAPAGDGYVRTVARTGDEHAGTEADAAEPAGAYAERSARTAASWIGEPEPRPEPAGQSGWIGEPEPRPEPAGKAGPAAGSCDGERAWPLLDRAPGEDLVAPVTAGTPRSWAEDHLADAGRPSADGYPADRHGAAPAPGRPGEGRAYPRVTAASEVSRFIDNSAWRAGPPTEHAPDDAGWAATTGDLRYVDEARYAQPVPEPRVAPVDRSDRGYGDRIDGWVRPRYRDLDDRPPSGDYWTPVPDDLYADPEPSARGYGWPVPVERLPAVPDYEPATGFDLSPMQAAEPTTLVPTWRPRDPDHRVRLPRSWAERDDHGPTGPFPADNPPAPRTGEEAADDPLRRGHRAAEAEPPGRGARSRPRPRPATAAEPESSYVSRHSAGPHH